MLQREFVIKHFARYLLDAREMTMADTPMGITVLSLDEYPYPNAVSVLTEGFTVFQKNYLKNKDNSLLQEFSMVMEKGTFLPALDYEDLIVRTSLSPVLRHGHAPFGSIVDLKEINKRYDFPFHALWVSYPYYFHEDLEKWETDEGRVHLAWLVPIFESEAAVIREKGSWFFNVYLEENDPNLADFSREPLF